MTTHTLRPLFVSLVLAGATACSTPASSPKVEPAKPAAEPAKPAAEPAKPADPPPPAPLAPEVEASRAYAATVAAADDPEKFLAGYADELVCFEKTAPARRDDVRKARVDVETGARMRSAPTVRSIDPTTVLLVERGVSTDVDNRPHVDERAVLMRRVADKWLIAGETDISRVACLGLELGDLEPDPAVAECDKKARACLKQCTCKVASNSCESCKDACTDGALACLGLQTLAGGEEALSESP